MLRRLQDEDLVIERGGIPVAILSPWRWGATASQDPRALQGDELAERMAEDDTMDETRLLSRIEEVKARYAAERRPARIPAAEAWERTKAAVRAGWDIDGDELIEDIYRWRKEGSRLNRYYVMNADGEITEVLDEQTGELSDRQRRLHRRDQPARYVADRGDEEYRV